MKKILRLLTLALYPLFFAQAVFAQAANKEFCADYVLVAISHYWQSVDEDCGFSGARWNANYKGQFDWCLSAHQWVVENESQARERLLQECRSDSDKSQYDKNKGDTPDKKGSVVVDKDDENNDNKVGLTASPLKSALDKRLLKAVANDNLKKVQQLVAKGLNVHAVTTDLALIKFYGMAYHTAEQVTSRADLADKPVNGIQTVTSESETLLSYAVSKGLVSVGLWLLEVDKAVLKPARRDHLKEKLLGNALINAVKEKDYTRTTELLKQGALIDYELDMNFGTPLHFAVTSGNTKIAKLLLNKGANPKYSTNGGQNILNYALENIELLRLLIDHGADPNANGESVSTETYPLYQAVKQGNYQAVELLMSKGAKADITDYQVPFPILLAIADQQVKTVEMLLKYGVDVNVVYNPGSAEQPAKRCAEKTRNLVPLNEAMKVDNRAIITLLKKAGAKTEIEICNHEFR